MEGEEGLRVLNRNKRADKHRPRGIYTHQNDTGGFLRAFWLIQLIVIPAMFRT